MEYCCCGVAHFGAYLLRAGEYIFFLHRVIDSFIFFQETCFRENDERMLLHARTESRRGFRVLFVAG